MKLTKFACAAALILASINARASDHGCTVLLCLANPNGPMALGECVPPIKKLFRDLARGHAFPSCAMGTSGNTNKATNRGLSLANCPEEYREYDDYEDNRPSRGRCIYKGAITVQVNGENKSTVYWNDTDSVVVPAQTN